MTPLRSARAKLILVDEQGGIIDNDATKIKDFLKMTIRAISGRSPLNQFISRL